MSMITNVHFVPTLLGALGNTYATGSYVRTLGFATIGDGGAAMYHVTGTTSVITDKAITYDNYTLYCLNGRFHIGFDSENTIRPVFEIIPSNGKIYAEQFGVLPNNDSLASTNVNLLSKAVAYSSDNGYTLTFASKGTYYLEPITINVQSNLFLDGNGATLHIIGGTDGGIGLFDSSSQVDNISIKNIILIGRKTSVSSTQNDQAIHIKSTNLSVQNVSFKFFDYAFHTYAPTEYAAYAIPSIPNKNWLIENCKTESCIFGLNTSEIDGLVIKDSDISCYLNSTDMAHCVYLSSNCSNVRVTGCNLHNVSGDAIHKAYAVPKSNPKGDASKNHFYTDLSIDNVDSALDIGIISQNVMCDNAFVTDVKIALQLSGADNCIVSNSHFEQTKSQVASETTGFIYAEDACNCWLQNSYVYYTGRHRATTSQLQTSYVENMFANKAYRRIFIGEEFKISNHWFKFTGCEFVSTHGWDYYFYEDFNSAVEGEKEPSKSQYGEYWDNCMFETNTDQVLLRLYCINDLPGGITIRNSFLAHASSAPKPPFRLWCFHKNSTAENNICSVCNNCLFAEYNKMLTWVRLENNIFNNFGKSDKWDNKYIYTIAGNLSSVNEAIKISNSYYSNCYRNKDHSFEQLD